MSQQISLSITIENASIKSKQKQMHYLKVKNKGYTFHQIFQKELLQTREYNVLIDGNCKESKGENLSLLGDTNSSTTPASCLCMLTSDTQAPIMTKTSMIPEPTN